jgi:tetratricopeptide (TPR) repeat protein
LVRDESVEALASLAADPNAPVATALRERLADPVRNVRIAAAWALAGETNHSSAAWNDLKRMLDVNSDQPAGQMQEGELALMQGDVPGGLAHYQKMVEWDATSPGARHDYAVLLSQANQADAALEQMEAACRLAPTNGEFQYDLALAYHAAGKETEVIPALKNALRLDSTLAPAWYNLGLALSSQGDLAGALDALVRAESLSPEARISYARATILGRMGRTADAKRAAERALELQPDFQPAQELLRNLGTR